MRKTGPMQPTSEVPEAVQRVQQALAAHGYEGEVRFVDDTARSAQEAADALGVSIGQIAKSIVFRRSADDAVVLVVTSGSNRVDITKVEELVGGVGKADAAFVRERTGFVIGGVSPVGMPDEVVVLYDRDLMKYDTVWAAAGHTHAVFEITPGALIAMLGVACEDVAVSEGEPPY